MTDDEKNALPSPKDAEKQTKQSENQIKQPLETSSLSSESADPSVSGQALSPFAGNFEKRETDAEGDQPIHFSRDFLHDVVDALEQKKKRLARSLVNDLHAADLAEFLGLLTSKQRRRLIRYLGNDIDPELFYEVEGEVQFDLYETASNAQIANAVTELETDDAIYVLEEMDEEDREEVLDHLPADERVQLEESLSYPEDSAGRLMQRDLIALPEFWTVGQTIDYLRREGHTLPEDFYDVFVVDPTHRLSGSVPLARLMRTPRPVRLSDVMDREVRSINVRADQEEVAYQFNKYHLISAPVLEDNGRIVGVVMVDDVIEVIEEEAEADILALAGVGDARTGESFSEITWARFTWLFINLLTAILASAVISAFDRTIEEMIALAVLMPIVASMGGNAGTQTMAVAVRGLATRELSERTQARMLRRELMMASLNGFGLAALSGGVAWAWFGDIFLAIIFAVGLLINVITAGLSGILIPLGLERFGVDPAVASSVFVTTITDVVGFFVFLGLAAIFLL